MLEPTQKKTNKVDLLWPIKKFIDNNFGKVAVEEHDSEHEQKTILPLSFLNS